MATLKAEEHDFLCVLSEWQSYNQKGGLLGNAYPIFCLSRNEVVTDPMDVFANPGYIFLLARGSLDTWSYLRIRPSVNTRYQNIGHRDCYYLSHDVPKLVAEPRDHPNVAAVVDVHDFDPAHPTFGVEDPRQNVTPLFFIRSQGRLFGPLLREQVVRDYDRVARVKWSCACSDYVLYELRAEDLSRHGVREVAYTHPEPELNLVIEHPFRLLVGPVQTLTSDTAFDMLPDGELASWYLRASGIADASLVEFAGALRANAEALSQKRHRFIESRLERLTSLVGTAEVLRDERLRMARQFLSTPEGEKALHQVLAQEVRRRSIAIQQQVEEREKELATRQQKLAAQLDGLDTVFSEKRAEIESKTHELAEEKRQLEDSLTDLTTQLGQSASELAERLRACNPLLAALVAARTAHAPSERRDHPPGMEASGSAWHDVDPIAPTCELSAPTDEAQYVNQLQAALSLHGLGYARDFVANVYACLKSAQLLLVTSPPGYGKSSLVRGFAASLGHLNSLLEIPVRRAWSDDRYLLGFYDAFHQRYDPGATGLAPHLVRAQKDWGRDKTGIYFVLLDEFNLAAPEYYFSQLMQVLFRDTEPREVRLFEPRSEEDSYWKVAIHPNVRFCATINYDETTERLSPRLLDRTGMIFLASSDCLPELVDEAAGPPEEFKGARAESVFVEQRRGPGDCPGDSWELFAKATEATTKSSDDLGAGFSLSPRSRMAVQTYLANARGVLPPNAAADFAFQQRVLPLLRGRGPQFDRRVDRVLEVLQDIGLDRSASHVRESKRIASTTFGEIDFFAY